MSRIELLRKIETLVNVDQGTLTGAEPLDDLPDWDSLAVLSLIALLDKEFGVVVKPATMDECQRIDSVIDLVGDRLTA